MKKTTDRCHSDSWSQNTNWPKSWSIDEQHRRRWKMMTVVKEMLSVDRCGHRLCVTSASVDQVAIVPPLPAHSLPAHTPHPTNDGRRKPTSHIIMRSYMRPISCEPKAPKMSHSKKIYFWTIWEHIQINIKPAINFKCNPGDFLTVTSWWENH